MTPVMNITADEINCLVYAYLQDSGFQHSSYALRSEARLDSSSHSKTPIRRGELVELLTKALLYTEVETHWRHSADATDCSAPFSLIIPHVCNANHPEPQEIPQPPIPASSRPELFPVQTNGISTSHDDTSHSLAQKRKASQNGTFDNRTGKRICIEDEDEEMPMVNSGPSISINAFNKTLKRLNEPHDVKMDVSSPLDASLNLPYPGFATKNVDLKEPIILLEGHTDVVFGAVWNPAEPDIVATGSKDATARIWNWDDIKATVQEDSSTGFAESQTAYPDAVVLRHLPESVRPDITSLDWNKDGTFLATGSFDRLLRVWRKTGELYMTQIYHLGPIYSVMFSPSGELLLSASSDGTACVWNLATKALKMEFKVHNGACLDVDWLNESTFVTCGANPTVCLVSLTSTNPIRVFTGHVKEVNQVKFNIKKTLLASCSDDATVRIWGREMWTNADGSIANAADNSAGSSQHSSRVVLKGHTSPVGALRWCPTANDTEETLLATCSFDRTVRLWDATKGDCLHVFSESESPLYSITFSADGRFLAAGTEDGYLYIYETATRRQIWRWPSQGPTPGPIYDVNWQKTGGNCLAICTQQLVGIVDLTKVPNLSLDTSSAPRT